jgi:hypothetical protein
MRRLALVSALAAVVAAVPSLASTMGALVVHPAH